MKTSYFLLLAMLLSSMACQRVPEPVVNTTLKAIEKPKKKKEKKTIEDRAQSVGERIAYEMELSRDPATGSIPADIRGLERKAAEQAPRSFNLPNGRGSSDLCIESRGPGNLGGRTRTIIFDQRDADIIVAGGVSSGVFRTTDGGANWLKVSSNNETHNVTAIDQDPTNPDVWYYGTGELAGNSATDAGGWYFGNGMWKSTDNGQTWNALPSTQPGGLYTYDGAWDYITRIVVHPVTGDVYATVGNAVQRSQDDGATWEVVLGANDYVALVDLIITPTGVLYAAFPGSDPFEGVWRSTTGDNGDWTKIAGAGSSTTPAGWDPPNEYGRIVLAYAPSAPQVVYALYDNGESIDCTAATPLAEAELYVWGYSGSVWDNRSANIPDEPGCLQGNDPFAVQGGYDLCIGVKPDNWATVFIGGTNVYRSTTAFINNDSERIGGYVSPSSYFAYANHHSDIHYFAFAPGDNNTLYTGSDGGIHKADITQASVAWTSLNNDYITYQFYHVDISPVVGDDFVIGGAQDNGTTISYADKTHSQVFTGDGVSVGVISRSGTDYQAILGAQFGIMYNVNSATGAFDYITPDAAVISLFVSYYYLDPDNTEYLWFAGGPDLFRTRIASSIATQATTGDSDTGWDNLIGVNTTAVIRAVTTSRNNAFGGAAYTSSDPNRLMLIGYDDGRVMRLRDYAFSNASTVPDDITPPVSAGGNVISISINPENNDEALVVYSNYSVETVFHTNNLTAATPTWINIEGPAGTPVQLGSARACMITAEGTETLYFVGTTTGLYCTDNPNGASTVWTKVGPNEIGYAIASSMRYRPDDQQLLVGTHGNGMFMLNLDPLFNPADCTEPLAAKCDATISGDTEKRSNNFTAYGSSTGWTGNEMVYEVTTTATSIELTLAVTNTSSADIGLFLLDACNSGNVIASANANGAGGDEQILNFSVTASTTYYVIVDAQAGVDAIFELLVDCIDPPSCMDGIQNQGEAGIDCGGPCVAICPTCNDGIQNQDETGIDCGGATCPSCPCSNISINITFDNYAEDIGWEIIDANSNIVASVAIGTYDANDDETINIPLCLPYGCYTFRIEDNYGDGLCCVYDPGFYEVVHDATATVFGTGSDFGAEDTFGFCVGVYVSPKVFLQGPLSGTSMTTNLSTSAVIPTSDPYTGTKSASSFTDVVDWVQVEIRAATTPTTIISSQSGLLKSDGYVTDANAGTPLAFDLPHGNYHIAVKHRNHLSVMTGTPVSLN